MTDFGTRALGGVLWRTLTQITVQVLGIVVTLALARLLSPRAFGLLAMAGSVSALVALFTGFGLGSALIQRQTIDEVDRRSVFTLNLAMSALLFGIIAALAYPAARFYDEPSLRYLLPLIALELPLSALGSVQRINLRRTLRYDALARVDIVGGLVGGALGIAAAAAGWGVMALVLRILTTALVQTTGLYFVDAWRPRLGVDREVLRSLGGFGLHVTGMELLGYLYLNVDKILIGRFLGDQALGLYSRAYVLMQLPPRVVGGSLGEVMFSALSTIRDEHARVRAIVLRVLGALGLAAFPLAALLYVIAEPLTEGVLGPRWEGFAPILVLLSFAAAGEAFFLFTRAIYRATGRVDLELRVLLPGPVVLAVALWLGLDAGLEGAARAFVLASYALGIPRVLLALRVVGLPWASALGAVLPSLLLTLASAAGASWATDAAGPLGPIAQLFVGAASLTALYALGLLLVRPRALRDVLALVRDARRPGR